MLYRFWAKITGADQKKAYPQQQVEALGRRGEHAIVYPYGLYCDTPVGTTTKQLCPSSSLPMAVERPDDLNVDEPCLYHPASNTRLIMRANGDLDIITDDSEDRKGSVNIHCINANVVADQNVSVEAGGTVSVNSEAAKVIATSVSVESNTINMKASTITMDAAVKITKTLDVASQVTAPQFTGNLTVGSGGTVFIPTSAQIKQGNVSLGIGHRHVSSGGDNAAPTTGTVV